MRILVFGAGAIGSVIGGFLATAGHDVTLLGRAWHVEAIREHGLRISGLWGTHHVRRLATATRITDLGRTVEFDWILVCVKAYQTAEAAEALERRLGPGTLVCSFQNGLGNYEALIARVAPDRVALARVIFGAELEPGEVRVSVCADDVLIGAPDPRFPSAQAAQLAAALQQSGIPSRATSTIRLALWAKVLYNCALNGLSTLFEVPYGKLLDHPVTRRLIPGIVEEAYRVADAHRIPLEPSSASAYCELLFTRLIPDTAAHRASMLQDLRAGKPTEIESLNGAIVRMAQQVGLSTPVNALVTRLVHTKERFVGVAADPQA